MVIILGPAVISIETICVDVPTLKQENVLVTICPDDNDRYRFGFNGQEKVNEWSGVGNFLDFGDRAQDTRTGRLGYTTDPLETRFPWQSPYVFAGNSPIDFLDVNGRLKVSNKETLAEYMEKYPLVMTYIQSGQLLTDILKSEKMIKSYNDFRPDYSRSQIITYIKFIAGWGTGPELEFAKAPGEDENSNSHAAGFFMKRLNTVQINERYISSLEKILKSDADNQAKLVAFTRFYMGITHELAHRVITADHRIPLESKIEPSESEIAMTNEAGYEFEQKVWGYKGYMPYDFYMEHLGKVEESGDYSDYEDDIHSRKFKKGVAEGVVENAQKTEEGGLSLPKFPK